MLWFGGKLFTKRRMRGGFKNILCYGSAQIYSLKMAKKV